MDKDKEKNVEQESKENEDWVGLGFTGRVGVGVDRGSDELVISERQFIKTGVDDQGREQYVRDTVRIKVPLSDIQDFLDKVTEAGQYAE